MLDKKSFYMNNNHEIASFGVSKYKKTLFIVLSLIIFILPIAISSTANADVLGDAIEKFKKENKDKDLNDILDMAKKEPDKNNFLYVISRIFTVNYLNETPQAVAVSGQPEPPDSNCDPSKPSTPLYHNCDVPNLMTEFLQDIISVFRPTGGSEKAESATAVFGMGVPSTIPGQNGKVSLDIDENSSIKYTALELFGYSPKFTTYRGEWDHIKVNTEARILSNFGLNDNIRLGLEVIKNGVTAGVTEGISFNWSNPAAFLGSVFKSTVSSSLNTIIDTSDYNVFATNAWYRIDYGNTLYNARELNQEEIGAMIKVRLYELFRQDVNKKVTLPSDFKKAQKGPDKPALPVSKCIASDHGKTVVIKGANEAGGISEEDCKAQAESKYNDLNPTYDPRGTAKGDLLSEWLVKKKTTKFFTIAEKYGMKCDFPKNPKEEDREELLNTYFKCWDDQWEESKIRQIEAAEGEEFQKWLNTKKDSAELKAFFTDERNFNAPWTRYVCTDSNGEDLVPKSSYVLQDYERKVGTASNKGEFGPPVSGSTVMTSPYGMRVDPYSGIIALHTGVDFASPEGTSILSVEAGKVIETGFSKYGYGNRVVVQHSENVKTTYSHLSKINVSVGQKVEKGDAVGLMGTTGNSTGSHLHFEVMINDKFVEPTQYLQGSIEYTGDITDITETTQRVTFSESDKESFNFVFLFNPKTKELNPGCAAVRSPVQGALFGDGYVGDQEPPYDTRRDYLQDSNIFDVFVSVAPNNVANNIFNITKFTTQLSNQIVDLAFAPILDKLHIKEVIIKLVESFRKSLYYPFIAMMITLAAIWVLISALKDRAYMKGIKDAILIILTFVLGAVLLHEPRTTFKLVDEVPSMIETAVLGVIFEIGSPKNDQICTSSQGGQAKDFSSEMGLNGKIIGISPRASLRTLECEIWRAFVFNPWIQGQWGTEYENLYANTSGKTTGLKNTNEELVGDASVVMGQKVVVKNWALYQLDVMSTGNITSKARNFNDSNVPRDFYRIVDAQAGPNDGAGTDSRYMEAWSGKNATGRLIIAFFSAIVAIVGLMAIASFALFKIEITLLSALMLFFLPFVLLIGVHPTFGKSQLKKYFGTILSLIIQRVFIVALLAVMLRLMTALSQATSFYMLSSILMIMVCGAFISYRKEIMRMINSDVSKLSGGVNAQSTMENPHRSLAGFIPQTVKSKYNMTRSYIQGGVSGFVGGYMAGGARQALESAKENARFVQNKNVNIAMRKGTFGFAPTLQMSANLARKAVADENRDIIHDNNIYDKIKSDRTARATSDYKKRSAAQHAAGNTIDSFENDVKAQSYINKKLPPIDYEDARVTALLMEYAESQKEIAKLDEEERFIIAPIKSDAGVTTNEEVQRNIEEKKAFDEETSYYRESLVNRQDQILEEISILANPNDELLDEYKHLDSDHKEQLQKTSTEGMSREEKIAFYREEINRANAEMRRRIRERKERAKKKDTE